MSELAAIKGVMRTMLDPVIYAIYVDLENGHYFRDAIKKFPNVFDDVYVGIVEAFFWNSFNPIEWLQIIETNIKENQEYRANFLKKSITYIGAIGIGVVASFILDLQIYDWLVEEYANFNKYVPDFTEFYHNLIWQSLLYAPLLFSIVVLAVNYLKNTSNQKVRTEFSKFVLGLPVVWTILREKTLYDFVNIYYLLKSSKNVVPSQVLLTTTNSLPSYYARQIFHEIYEAVREGKNIGEEMEEYEFFNDEEDIIKIFKWSQENEFELAALRNILKKRLNEKLANTFVKVIFFIVIAAVSIVLCIAKAYLLPIQQKTWLIKQQLNEQKIDNYIENRQK